MTDSEWRKHRRRNGQEEPEPEPQLEFQDHKPCADMKCVACHPVQSAWDHYLAESGLGRVREASPPTYELMRSAFCSGIQHMILLFRYWARKDPQEILARHDRLMEDVDAFAVTGMNELAKLMEQVDEEPEEK